MVASKKEKSKVQKKPKYSPEFSPSDRNPRIESNPQSNRNKRPAWNISLLDLDGPWSFKDLKNTESLINILGKLKNFESMTWQEILDASGGRRRGNNNHEIPASDLINSARKRLKELKLDDITHLFSLRLTGTQRIWGILDGNILKIIWYDPDHKICPSCT